MTASQESNLPPIARAVAEVYGELRRTQWLPTEALETIQLTRLRRVTEHFYATSPWFRHRLRRVLPRARSIAGWEDLRKYPLLTRRELLKDKEHIVREELAHSVGPLSISRSSGSTGEPVEVYRTEQNEIDWMASSLREHCWHGRDFSRKYCAIIAGASEPATLDHWGTPVRFFHPSAPSLILPSRLAIESIAKRLVEFQPSYLLCLPSILSELIEYLRRAELRLPELKEVRVYGETLDQELINLTRKFLRVPLCMTYATQEVGNIASSCASGPLLHVNAEFAILEILDQSGNSCKPGESGSVVVTDLRNYATPLIRYEIGDIAEVGPQCKCGRGLPAITHIVGRKRNLLVLPDGRKIWPPIGTMLRAFREHAQLDQYQLLQVHPHRLLLRLRAPKLSIDQEQVFSLIVQKFLSSQFEIDFEYVYGPFARDPSGKFEDFKSLL